MYRFCLRRWDVRARKNIHVGPAGLQWSAGLLRFGYNCSFASNRRLIFRPMKIGTTMHEFCHSFANLVVEKHMAQLRPVDEKLTGLTFDRLIQMACHRI